MTEKLPNHDPIEARVAQILNAKELVINVGSDSSVEPNMIFAVMAESPIEIRDPTSNEVLDTIDREKVRVKVTEVRKRIAICKTFRTFGPLGEAFGALNASKIVLSAMRDSRPETLRIEDDATPPPLSEEESYVKVNDRVVRVYME